MQYEYEQISYDSSLPVKIFTHIVDKFPYHWHEDLEMLFVLSGKLEISVHQNKYQLHAGDVFLINGRDLHFVYDNSNEKDTQLLVLQMNHHYLEHFDIQLERKRFHVNSNQPEGVP